MMEVRRIQFDNPDHPEIIMCRNPLCPLQGAVVDNYSIALKRWVQPREDKLGKRCYKHFLSPRFAHTEIG